MLFASLTLWKSVTTRPPKHQWPRAPCSDERLMDPRLPEQSPRTVARTCTGAFSGCEFSEDKTHSPLFDGRRQPVSETSHACVCTANVLSDA